MNNKNVPRIVILLIFQKWFVGASSADRRAQGPWIREFHPVEMECRFGRETRNATTLGMSSEALRIAIFLMHGTVHCRVSASVSCCEKGGCVRARR
ncbi:hypothetical protein IW261DRAFT_1018245 [Armillaria novae-zelandiae]|uniref:Secreted protein n=1 Tax=Armillaria novae-zelandiae TaxID=153914 RepID=A0AA39TWQ6_9AGAR|nr:hypothetical protein IW261DRAFT_1018245 [Armillaria novae-zelandiae]